MSETQENVEVYDGPYAGQEDKAVKVELYDAAQGKSPRTGGPYLDDVERHNAETWRAQKEGREPDYDNPGPVAGTRLVPKHELVERDTDKSHYSDAVAVSTEPVASYVVEPTKNEPDPTQPDYDNDYAKLGALEAGERLEKLKSEAKARKESETSSDEPVITGNESPNTSDSLTASENINPAGDPSPEVVDPENTARTETSEDPAGNPDDVVNSDQLWLDEQNKSDGSN